MTSATTMIATPAAPQTTPPSGAPAPSGSVSAPKKDNFFRTMTTEEYKAFSSVLADAPQPKKEAALAAAAAKQKEAAQQRYTEAGARRDAALAAKAAVAAAEEN